MNERLSLGARRARSTALAAFVAALSVQVSPAHAGIDQLVWSAPRGCPDRAWAHRRLDTLLGPEAARAYTPMLAVQIERRGNSYVAALRRVRDAMLTRELRGARCASIARAASVLVAWSLREDEPASAATSGPDEADPPHDLPAVRDEPLRPVRAATSGASAAPAPAPAPPVRLDVPRNAPPATPLRTRRTVASEPRSLRARAAVRTTERDARAVLATVTLGAVVERGIVPSPNPALEAGVGVAYRRLRADLSFALRFAQSAFVEGSTSVGGSFRPTTVHLRVGALAPIGPLSVGGFAGVELGVMASSGLGVVVPVERTDPWIAPGADAELHWRATESFALRVGLGLRVPLGRPQYVIDRARQVFEPESVVLRGGAGIVVSF